MAESHTLVRLPPLCYKRRMDLSAEIFRTSGRARRPLSASFARELDEGDLALLQVEKGSQPAHIKRLSERHHALARNLAGGMAPGEAAIVCGYSPSRVSILQDDPAFKELLSFYRRDVEIVYRDLHQRLSGLALDAVEELAGRLEDEPEKISVGQLMEPTKMGADYWRYSARSPEIHYWQQPRDRWSPSQ